MHKLSTNLRNVLFKCSLRATIKRKVVKDDLRYFLRYSDHLQFFFDIFFVQRNNPSNFWKKLKSFGPILKKFLGVYMVSNYYCHCLLSSQRYIYSNMQWYSKIDFLFNYRKNCLVEILLNWIEIILQWRN